MRIEYHRTLIADQVRVTAYADALARVIRKGETVVADIGTGTGLLAFLAAKLGARKVYAYEMAEIGELAVRLKALNKMRNVELIASRSTEMIDPPRVDVVVTETLGNYALEEYLVETMNDARARHLKPAGVLIPSGLEQFVCPVVAPRVFDELCIWDRIGHGLDLAPARLMSLNNAYVRAFPPAELFDQGRAAVRWDRLDFYERNRMQRRGEAAWTLRQPARIYGLALWWTAGLVDDIALTTSPLAASTHWEQLYFPALAPLAVKAGETLTANIRSRSSEEGGTDLVWTLAVTTASRRERVRQSLCLDRGFLP
jgi:type I protein arginine methyltransferase